MKKHLQQRRTELQRKNISVGVRKSYLNGRVGTRKGAVLTEETKQKMREKALLNGNKPSFLGRKHTKETIQKLSISHTGIRYINRKRPPKFTIEHRKKISKALMGSGSSFWKGGISYEPYSVDWTKTLRRSIRERDCYTCQLCKKQQNDVGFPVHHIDYNKKNCNIANLITLCRKCHTKTNNNRNYWLNYFNGRI